MILNNIQFINKVDRLTPIALQFQSSPNGGYFF
jgi:hypothetical protein